MVKSLRLIAVILPVFCASSESTFVTAEEVRSPAGVFAENSSFAVPLHTATRQESSTNSLRRK